MLFFSWKFNIAALELCSDTWTNAAFSKKFNLTKNDEWPLQTWNNPTQLRECIFGDYTKNPIKGKCFHQHFLFHFYTKWNNLENNSNCVSLSPFTSTNIWMKMKISDTYRFCFGNTIILGVTQRNQLKVFIIMLLLMHL